MPGPVPGQGSDGEPPAAERIHYEVEDDSRSLAAAEQAAWIADALGGAWQRDAAGGTCLVVERYYPADHQHGALEIGAYAQALDACASSLDMFRRSRPPRTGIGSLFSDLDDRTCALPEPQLDALRTSDVLNSAGSTSDLGLRTSDVVRKFLFFDLETTGLSGGAGTCAFLVGFGWFDGAGFRTRQYFLGGFGHEPALLRIAAEPLGRGATLGSFNGKTFDVPLINGRYLFHRVPSPFDDVPHIDLLHPARRLWRHRPASEHRVRERTDALAGYLRSAALREQYRAARGVGNGRTRQLDLSDSAASCALGALEDVILAYGRTGDVPGAEIPSRYFHYVRTGDARPLVPVLEHNRLDLVSLAALAAVMARMLHEGAVATRNAHECLALGQLYERSGVADRARACYQRAADGETSPMWHHDAVVQREALKRLAIRHRREGRHDEAAAAWQRLVDLGPEADLEALHALAVYHEHRSKNLPAAHALVQRAIGAATALVEKEALRRRLDRIERKIGR